MTAFDGKRLTNATLKLDVDGLRRGHYADIYFQNVVHILKALQASEYRFSGHSPRVLPLDESSTQIGDLMVEAQIFNRRKPYALIAGIDVALAMLRHVTGYYYDAQFIETWHELEVDAVQDGVITKYAGDVEHVKTVIEVRGRYRDFALLETTMLGVLTRTSRIATNVYDVLKAANGKGVLFFPARFDLPQVQAIDGYAYWLAVQRYNRETGHDVHPLVSTDAQASWWGGKGGGTIPHALVACFLADTVEAMLAYARHLPSESPRIALVDFDNDTVNTSRAVLNAFWTHYRVALESGNEDEQQRWTLHGIRLDTSASVRDVSLPPDAPTGVSPALVRLVREALNNAWKEWRVPHDLEIGRAHV